MRMLGVKNLTSRETVENQWPNLLTGIDNETIRTYAVVVNYLRYAAGLKLKYFPEETKIVY